MSPATTPLTFWKDLCPDPFPLRQPTATSARVLIIGGGISSLATAWCLLDKSYKVTIVSKEWANESHDSRLTAQIAGALWEFPPAVCGSHTNETSLAYSKHWAMVAYHIWNAIANEPGLPSGLRVMPANFFFPYAVEEDRRQLHKMNEIMASGVRGFVHDSALAAHPAINLEYGAKDAYQHLSVVIDTDQAMSWLMGLVESKGASLVTETIKQDLLDVEDSLRARFNADVIVNCTGLASRHLASDPTCYALRGAVLRLVNDGATFPKIDEAFSISADAVGDKDGIVFIVPRNDNTLILGGFAQPGKEKLNLSPDSPEVQRMRKRCERFMPCLKDARLDPEYPLAQGLRPARKENVRVERELRARLNGGGSSRIIHNYGHGGSGWSFSFGCAAEVLKLVQEALADALPTGMGWPKVEARL